jgi:hypothetical protein
LTKTLEEPPLIMPNNNTADLLNKEKGDFPKRLDTCNQCPIFIEEYEVNFEKTTTLLAKQSSYWDKLNGNQKLAKFRRYIEQNLKILKYELENKCEFAK